MTTSVKRSQLIVKMLTQRENVLNVVMATIFTTTFALLMIQTVMLMDGLMLQEHGILNGLQEEIKYVNVAKMDTISIATTFVKNYLLIVKKLKLMEHAFVVNKVMTFVMENV